MTTADAAWRHAREHWLIPYGGTLLLIGLGVLALLYLVKGPLGSARNDGPRAIERFTPFERVAHWTNAIAFCLLAASGVAMAFGPALLPLPDAVIDALRSLHSLAGPLFAISLPLVLIIFLKDNVASRGDLRWLARGGGMLGGQQLPSHRFNPAEKIMFWCGMFFPGLISVGSGLALDGWIPELDDLRLAMPVVHLIHLAATLIMMAALAGHIYMGTIGVRGAYRAMRGGWVDEAWAREHHRLWHDEVVAGHIPARRSGAEPVGERVDDRAP